MFIEEIVLEGFKTYMNRIVINGFDPQFNAITGLNGSGKSNILDAIQFLLGSTSKEMLRLKAGLSELIYKEGFAGIEKASVTIRFRCIDKNMRPSGYEGCQQLVVTRQITKDKVTKFFVNGLASNLSKVKSLFRSVHLNIQNPHFLVKQGQITKVINLKPLQLLGMIEETAGTAYYNRTKLQSQKIMAKKDLKLKSINQILNASIMPQMEKLNADRRRYNAYRDKEAYLKRLNEQIKNYQYATKTKHCRKLQSEIIHLRETLANKKITFRDNTQKIAQAEGQIKLLRNKSENLIDVQYQKLKNALAEKSNQNNQVKARIETLNSQVISLKKDNNTKQENLDRKKKQIQWQAKMIIQSDKQKEQFQGLLHQITLSNNQKDAKALLEKQIKQTYAQVKSIQAEISSMNSKKEILKLESDNQKKQKQQLNENVQSLNKNMKDLNEEIQQLQKITPPKAVDDPQLHSSQMKRLQSQKNKFINQNYNLKFYYNDPYPNFDRSKVKGKLFTLFKVNDRIHQKALEIGAQGKLFNIVVDDEITSKTMIEKQCFGKNVTVIPNNKVTYKSLKDQTVIEARRIAFQMKGLAQPAYQLIQYDPNITNSIKFGFADFIVCSNQQIAKRIAFNSNRLLACKCVTYEGDVVEPGTLTGGHTNTQMMIIPQYNQYKQIQEKLADEIKKYNERKNTYEDYLGQMNTYRNKKKQLQVKCLKKDKLKNKIISLSLNLKEKDYAKQIQDIQEKIWLLRAEKQMHEKKAKQMKERINQGGKSIDQQQKQIEKQKKACELKLSDMKKTSSMLQVEVQQLLKILKRNADGQDEIQKQIYNLQRRQKKLQSQISDLKMDFEKIEQQRKRYLKEQAITQNQVGILTNQLLDLKVLQQKLQAQSSHLQLSVDSTLKQINNLKEAIKKILQQCPWISTDKQVQIHLHFNYQAAMQECKGVTLQVDKLKKTAKMNIDDLSYQKLQQQYKDLLEKRQILQKDKLTLLTNIHDLDQKRTVTLKHCFDIVKQNLGRIFTDLLPGSQAILNLVDQNDVTQGAQLSVHFNKVKKQLSELSGGQRSLLALSFILSLLLYKPSPFYILDQIDSALDLSHTQNIGYMISQRFPQSQFIIISLKEGMFQNANVLYKVSFIDGQSKVQRQTLKKK